MGPVKTTGQITSFLGVRGGVGCSFLAALLTRFLSRKRSQKVALVDSTPFSYSLIPSYLSINTPKHYLGQLEPYKEHLTAKLIEDYFSTSPEGAVYIPLNPGDEGRNSVAHSLPLLEKLSPWLSEIFLDLSSFPSDQTLSLLENSSRVFLICAPDATSLNALKQWKKRLLAAHLDLANFYLIFNQENSSQSIPKDISSLADRFQIAGTVPFLGTDLSIQLFENGLLTPTLEKTLGPLVEKLQESKAPSTQSGKTEQVPSAESVPTLSLEDIHHLHQKLLEHLRRSGALKDQPNSNVLQKTVMEPKAREILNDLIQEMNVSDRETRQKLVTETLNLAFGLGPLEPLLQNEEVTEIMVNGARDIFVEKRGLLEKTDVRFLDDQQLRTAIERILAPIGRRIDESQPYVDGRLQDGSRINAVIPPLSLNGPVLTIRKFSKKKLGVADLVRYGSITQEAADFLGACVRAKKNIIVSGGTGSGKTTLLNILSNFIPSNERIVTIEDSAELQLDQDHVVRLESRPANLEGKGHVAIRDLVINSLRMRPDRIVVGECRGGEALDMLQAMNTGHDGSLTTAHANAPRDVLSRLETMCLFTGLELPVKAIREQIARAIHLVVQQNRLPGGRRSVTQISAIQGMEGDVIILQDVFAYEEGTGLVRRPFAPAFIGDLNAIGYQWPGHSEKVKA